MIIPRKTWGGISKITGMIYLTGSSGRAGDIKENKNRQMIHL